MLNRRSILIAFFTLLISAGGIAQENLTVGSVNIRNYSTKEYGGNPQVFDITQDNRGVLYFANQRGVIEYDGVHWRTIKIDGENKEVNSVEVDTTGKVYVGVLGNIGYLAPNEVGTMEFVSLLENVPEEHRDFKRVDKIHITRRGVFFQCKKKLILWDGEEMKVWAPSEGTTFHLSFYVNDRFFITQKDMGLYELVGGSINLMEDGVRFSTAQIYGFNYFNGEYLIFTGGEGVYTLDEYDRVQKHSSLGDINVYNSVAVDEDYIALGLFADGILVLNSELKRVYHINTATGMTSGNVLGLFLDNEKNLWAGTVKGITKVEVISPVSIFGSRSGLKSTVEDIVKHKGTIYIAAYNGVYYIDQEEKNINERIKNVENLSVDCYGVESFAFGSDTVLLVAANHGVPVVRNKKAETIAEGGPYSFLRSRSDPNQVYVCHYFGLSRLEWNGSNFVNRGFVPDLEYDIFNMELEDDGTLWLGTMYNGVIKTNEKIFSDTTTERKFYSKDNGVPDGPIFVKVIDGKPYFGTENGLYTLDGDQFVLANNFGVDFSAEDIGVHRISVDPAGRVWMVLFDENNNYDIGYATNQDGEYVWKNKDFLRHSDEIIHGFFHDGKDITWLGGPSGLLRYDAGVKKDYKIPFNVRIRQVTYGSDTLFNGTFIDEEGRYSLTQESKFNRDLDFNHNTLRFYFGAMSFVDEEATLYSYKLEGQDDSWSDWTTNTEATYTNIEEGRYTFRVRARNLYNNESTEATFEFEVLPPWYRTIWAYIGYVIAFFLIVYGAIRFSIRRVKKQNERLEGIVKERTAEVVSQKEEIEKQKEIVEEKNKDIMDSIKYAKRIQDAIMPSEDYVRKLFKDAFVLYKPKDIVSGDFYWIKEKGDKILFAAVDCTGHGVPGAFVSIIGNNGLNRAINEFDLTDPGKILDKLTELVEEAFVQQGIGENDVKDGMDIALCVLDRTKGELQYAGANNPLYLIRDGELTETKADKQPIGQFDERVPFTTHTIQLKGNDAFYVFSDGYADQFGGPKGKKFKYRTFRNLLQDIVTKPMVEQRTVLNTTFKDWRGTYEQLDDVCVIGVRV